MGEFRWFLECDKNPRPSRADVFKNFLKFWGRPGDPKIFRKENEKQIEEKLSSFSRKRRKAALAEANRLHAKAIDQAESIEKRAATLQGAAAIAATLAVTGSGLFLRSEVEISSDLEKLCSFLLIVVVFCLVATAFRSVQAFKPQNWWEMPAEGVLKWSSEDAKGDQILVARKLLMDYGHNARIVEFKAMNLYAASAWFVCSLAAMLIFVAVAVVGAASFDSTKDPDSSRIVCQKLRSEYRFDVVPEGFSVARCIRTVTTGESDEASSGKTPGAH